MKDAGLEPAGAPTDGGPARSHGDKAAPLGVPPSGTTGPEDGGRRFRTRPSRHCGHASIYDPINEERHGPRRRVASRRMA